MNKDLEELEELKEDNLKCEEDVQEKRPGTQSSDLSIDLADLNDVLLPLCRVLKNFGERLQTIEIKLGINSNKEEKQSEKKEIKNDRI